MSVRQTLLAQLARYDDEAFAALASRGLLRRAYKDLEKLTASVIEETVEFLVIDFAGQHVRIDARGLAHAECSCRAASVCQHIIASGLALNRLAQTGGSEVASPEGGVAREGRDETGTSCAKNTVGAPSQRPEADMAALHKALIEIPPEALIKHAGKAGYRWAWQFVQDLDTGQSVEFAGERHIVIGFKRPCVSFHFMGGGVAGLLADQPIKHLARFQVAAAIAYQRGHETVPPPTDSSNIAETASLDHTASARTRNASRRQLRRSGRRLLEDCVGLGLSHLTRNVHERFATLAVWAQGVEYYRLALLLRRLADHVNLLLERTGSADEHRLFADLSLTYGLISALESASSRGLAPAMLVGQARSRYFEAGNLELLGLGAMPWRSASGYVGLTLIFWSPTEKAFLTSTDARPEVLRTFNPLERYTAPGPWAGLPSPRHATGHRVRLMNALVSGHRRLSSSATTTALTCPEVDLIAQLSPIDRWEEISAARAGARRSLLEEYEPWRDWVILAPTVWLAPTFDDARQILTWPVLDATGDCLRVELTYSEINEPAIECIEQIAGAGVPSGTLLVARLRGGASDLVALPVSLVRSNPRLGEDPIIALYFDLPPSASSTSRKRAGSWRNSAPFSSHASVAMTNGNDALKPFRLWLQRQAERGFADKRVDSLLREFTHNTEHLATMGFTCFSPANNHAELAGALIAAHYTCMQYQRLLDDEMGEPDMADDESSCGS